MHRLSISTRLYLLIGLSTLALVAVIGATLIDSANMMAAGRRLHDEGALGIERVSRLALLFEEQKEAVVRAVAEVDRDRIEKYRNRFEAFSQVLSTHLQRLAPFADRLVENSRPRLAMLLSEHGAQASAIFDLARQSMLDKARDLLHGPFSANVKQIDAIIDEWMDAATTVADEEEKALAIAWRRMTWTVAGVCLLSVAIFNGFGIFVTRRLMRDLSRSVAELRALSAGSTENPVTRDGDPDEITAMTRAIEVFRAEIFANRQMAAELRRSQQNLAHAQQVTHTGSAVRNLRTDEVEWSDEIYRILGVSRESFIPSRENLLRLLHPEDRVAIEADWARIAQGQRPESFEFRVVWPDGTVRYVHREGEVLRDGNGYPLSQIITIRDVTEIREAQARERELERQLMHSQKLEALGTLAGGVAHDLNNTLVPILALSKMALDELPETNPVRGDIETIVKASERARDLVKQILAFSRKKDLAKQEADLTRVMREALLMLRASVPATIQIVDQILDVPPVLGDPGELHQVIVNLVTNAAQAIGSAVGRITVRMWGAADGAPHCKDNPTIFLSVADTGCGMDEATVERIFEPFFTTKGVGEGTGLGLSVVHGIVTRHGGTITVRSELGEGSEFTLALPATPQHPRPAQFDTVAA